jgi:hypothetical protein
LFHLITLFPNPVVSEVEPSQIQNSFNYAIRPSQHVRRNRQAYLLCGF